MIDLTPKYFFIWDGLNDDDRLKVITKFGGEKFDIRNKQVERYLLKNFTLKSKTKVITK